MKYILVLIATFFISIISLSQDELCVQFPTNTSDLSKDEMNMLDSLYEVIKENDFIEDCCYLVVQGFYTEEEYQYDNYIGIKRGKNIIDYYVSKGLFKRNFFLINDMGIEENSMRFKSIVCFYVMSKSE